MKWRGLGFFPVTTCRYPWYPIATVTRASNKQRLYSPSTFWKLYSATARAPQVGNYNTKPSSANHESLLLSAKPLNIRCVELLSSQSTRGEGGAPENSFKNRLVTVTGRIRTIRKQRKIAFAAFNDGSCAGSIQVVFLDPAQIGGCTDGVTVQLTGTWRPSEGPHQDYEMQVDQTVLLGQTDVENYPIQKKNTTSELLRTIPHLRLRMPDHSALARFRSNCLSALNSHFQNEAGEGGYFAQVQPPIITSSDCEGAGEVFTVASNSQLGRDPRPAPLVDKGFFNAPRYLTVSSQLHLEAYAAELRNVWALSPTFRAEPSDTPRHLAEFYMLEVELGYVTSIKSLTNNVQRLITSLVSNSKLIEAMKEVQRASSGTGTEDITSKDSTGASITQRWEALQGNRPWQTITYSDCISQLAEAAAQNPNFFEHPPNPGSSLKLEHERWIVEHIGLNRPIFVTHYPKAIKPFYMAPSDLDNASPDIGSDTVACFDLLFPFGAAEVAGGSLREHRLEPLIENMRAAGLLRRKPTTCRSPDIENATQTREQVDKEYPHLHPEESLGSLKWYADLRRYGTMPHGGFGIGWDRLIAYLAGVHNLRDVVAFPRSHRRAEC